VTFFLLCFPVGRNQRIVLPCVLTAVVQISLGFVIVTLAEERSISSQSEFVTWRTGTDLEVVRAVCTDDASLSTSFRQASTVKTLTLFTRLLFGEGDGLHSVGPLTSCIVCCTWLLSIVKELVDIMDKLLGVLQHTNRNVDTMELVMSPSASQSVSNSTFRLSSITVGRAAWVVCVSVVQGGTAIFLLVAGMEWLMSTTEVKDLFLKVVVLSYMMELDELVYSVFVPQKYSTLVSRLEPFPVKWPRPLRGLLLVLAGVPVIIGTALGIDAQWKDAVAIRDTLCLDLQ